MRQTEREYAEALFALAVEEENCSDILSDIRTVRDAFSAQPLYTELLASPAIPLSERLGAISRAFGERANDSTVNFLMLLCEKGRIRLFSDIVEEFEKLYREYTNVATAQITSAVPMSEEQKKLLAAKLEKTFAKKVDPVYNVDATLIGGVRVEIEGKIYDGSIKGRLRDVKDVMLDDATGRNQ